MDKVEDAICCGNSVAEHFEKISNLIDFHQGKSSNLIQILHASQNIYGYLPLEVQEFISNKMHIPLSEVTGVISFYSFFSTIPRGENTILVCMGTACYVRGGKKLIEELEKQLDIHVGETTKDGKFTLEIARCIGACGLAPAMMINKKVYKSVSPSKLRSILSRY